MRPSRKLPIVLAAGIAVGVPVAAQDQGQELSLSALLDIKLQTGSFLELDMAKSPLSMTLIDRDKIRVSGARHLTELLEIYVPGFQYMYNKWNGAIWGMRGVANDRNTKIIFLVNGHKMNTEARDGAFQELELGLLGDIERVEVLRGPAGLVYGSGAIAGIVNVVTRGVESDKTEVQADFGTGSNFAKKSWGIDARAYSAPTEGQSLVATVGYRESEGFGVGETRLYGNPHWPYPQNNAKPAGVPSDGSFGATPGNWRTSLDWAWNDFRLYGRMTHQVSEAGGLFVLDPWASIMGGAPTGTPAVMVDGKAIDSDDPFWSQTESWSTARREYVADNIAADASYTLNLGEDQVKFHGAFDANTNRIQREMRPGYETVDLNERNSFIEETFGERRYTIGAMYLMKSIPSLQIAGGAEQRWDDIGDDLTGRNSQAQKGMHPIVTDILYTNTALFTEGFYDFQENLGFGFGARWDGHTRTLDDGGTINGKLATVYTPVPGHTVKLIVQSSSNNGSADNYEFNRNNFNDAGVPYTTPHYEKPKEVPGGNSNAITGATEAQLHQLKPEKVYSFELTSNHEITPQLSMSPSVSYNMVKDLFAWSQDLFRVVNAGSYNHLDLEGEMVWNSKKLSVGLNHAFQMPVNTDPDKEAVTLNVPRYTRDSLNGSGAVVRDASGKVIQVANYRRVIKGIDTTYIPVQNGMRTAVVNPVRDQITANGSDFLSLATNVSKLYVDYKPLDWVTLHTDARIFWGLSGRDSMYTADENHGINNWGITRDIMTKLDASALFALPQDVSVGFYVYNILGVDEGTSVDNDLAINTLRWQQMGSTDHKDLFAVDVRSYAVTLQKSF
ncbi:MAG: TonB-dependent receptor plug domain-containing protein [Fibrobacteria bacterium]|nr:TonB-dependent receptor plug domain-containing protein [Fibrobacteria bacterium]